MIVHPVVVGDDGYKRLFEKIVGQKDLNLLSTRTYKHGTTLMCYALVKVVFSVGEKYCSQPLNQMFHFRDLFDTGTQPAKFWRRKTLRLLPCSHRIISLAPGDRLIIHEVDTRFGDDITRSNGSICYDLASKKYLARSYDDRGHRKFSRLSLKERAGASPVTWFAVQWQVRCKGQQFDRIVGRKRPTRLVGNPWIKLELVRAYWDCSTG